MSVSEIKFHTRTYSFENQMFNSLEERAISDTLNINSLIVRVLCHFNSDNSLSNNWTRNVLKVRSQLPENQYPFVGTVRKCPCQIILKHQCLRAIQRFCNVLFSDTRWIAVGKECSIGKSNAVSKRLPNQTTS